MKVVDLGINGEGIAKEDGKVYFVKGALVGEDVTVKKCVEKSRFTNCEVDRILVKSKDRVKPQCPYFSVCGGCQIQHLCYEKQLEYKQKLVKETLKKVGGFDTEVEECIASPKEYFYRNKNVFPVFFEDGHSQIGMFMENSKTCVEIEKCFIAEPEINRVLKITSDFLKDKFIEGFRYLVVRSVDGKVIITLVVEKKEISFLKKYLQTLQMNLKDFILNLNINTDKNTILSNEFISVYGDDSIATEDMGIQHSINAGSFIQVNNEIREKLYASVLENFSENDIVIDAYCGAGLLSAMIARKVRYCYGVEISTEAIKAANDMQRKNKIDNLYFINGDCDKEIPSLLENIEEEFSVILDPPRKGCTENVLNGIVAVRPQKVVYVSCNPITLAKDLKILVNGGYKLKKVQPFDMFPQTSNVETLVILEK